MNRPAVLIVVLTVLLALAGPALAGSAEERAALRLAADWAADTLSREMPTAPKVREAGIERIGILVGPDGPHASIVHDPLSNAVAGLENMAEMMPYQDITDFTTMVLLGTEEVRYDPETIFELNEKYRMAQAVLLVGYEARDLGNGRTEVALDMSLWDGKTAVKLWGANRTVTHDVRLIVGIEAQIARGEIEKALTRIGPALAEHPELRTDLVRLRTQGEKLRNQAEALARIQAAIDQNRVDEALESIRELYAAGDPALREALWGHLTDVRAKLLEPIDVLVKGEQLARAEARIAAVEEKHPDDLDLAKDLARQRRNLERIRSGRRERLVSEIDAALAAGRYDAAETAANNARIEWPEDEGLGRALDGVEARIAAARRTSLVARIEVQIRNEDYDGALAAIAAAQAQHEDDGRFLLTLQDMKTRVVGLQKKSKLPVYVVVGLIALVVIGLILRSLIGRGRDRARLERGEKDLGKGSDQADRVNHALERDADFRRRMGRELDKAGDALDSGHDRAKDGGDDALARAFHQATGAVRELARRLERSPAGRAGDFVKGKVADSKLDDLLAEDRMLEDRMKAIAADAVTAGDVLKAGGDPAAKLEQIRGLAEELGGKLSDRDSFFEKA